MDTTLLLLRLFRCVNNSPILRQSTLSVTKSDIFRVVLGSKEKLFQLRSRNILLLLLKMVASGEHFKSLILTRF